MDWNHWNDEIEWALSAWHDDSSLEHNIDTLSETFTSQVLACTEENIPKKVVCKHSRPYFTPELKALQDKFREAR